jgi:hypothetical protein
MRREDIRERRAAGESRADRHWPVLAWCIRSW